MTSNKETLTTSRILNNSKNQELRGNAKPADLINPNTTMSTADMPNTRQKSNNQWRSNTSVQLSSSHDYQQKVGA